MPRQNLDNLRLATEKDSWEEEKLAICRVWRIDLAIISSGVTGAGTELSAVRLGPALFVAARPGPASSPVFELSLLFFRTPSILKSEKKPVFINNPDFSSLPFQEDQKEEQGRE